MRRDAYKNPGAAELMDATTHARLQEIACDVTLEEKITIEEGLSVAVTTARRAAHHWAFEAPCNAIGFFISAMFHDYSSDALTRIRKVIVARLLLGHFAPEDALAPSVIDVYPLFFSRLAEFLSGLHHGYRFGFFAKDVRYALGLTIPCGLVQLDLRYRIGPKLVLRDALGSSSIRVGFSYVAARSWRRWYNTHIDPRDMSEFNPAGWTRSFCRIADMLELNREVRGAAGVSWYYDPAVAEISPNLAYLRCNQTENGAFSLRLGPDPLHTKNALFASRVRQQLYEDGKYFPTAFLIAWPRRRLIAWTRSASVGAEVSLAQRQAHHLPIPHRT